MTEYSLKFTTKQFSLGSYMIYFYTYGLEKFVAFIKNKSQKFTMNVEVRKKDLSLVFSSSSHQTSPQDDDVNLRQILKEANLEIFNKIYNRDGEAYTQWDRVYLVCESIEA